MPLVGLSRGRLRRRRGHEPATFCRAELESLEDRTVLSVAARLFRIQRKRRPRSRSRSSCLSWKGELPVVGWLEDRTLLSFLGTAGNYNVYVSGNMAQIGADVATSVAVGGNANLSNFTIGGVSGSGLIVGGNLSSSAAQVLSGNAQVGGSVTMGSNDNAALSSGAALEYGSATGNTFPLYPIFNITHVANGGISPTFFSGANATLTSDSSVLASQTQNGTVTFAYGTLTLTGTNASINYFSVSGATWPPATLCKSRSRRRDRVHQRKRRHGSVLECEYFNFRHYC